MSLILENSNITSSQSLFLFVLYSNPSLSGIQIVNKMQKKIGTDWIPTPGARYKILQKLEEKGLIEETTDYDNRKDKRIRTYKTTSNGVEMVKSQIERMNIMLEFITDCCPDYFQDSRKFNVCKDGEC